MKDLKLDLDNIESINKAYKFTELQKIAKKIYHENREYSEKELLEFDEKMGKMKHKKKQELMEKIKNINDKVKQDNIYINEVVDNISKKYKELGLISSVDLFLDELQSIVGNEAGTGTDIYLRENSYIIDHDYSGFKLEKSVILTDNNNKIFYKQNHPFFKTDVIYYSSYKNGKIDIYYDATTKILLGYKKESKNYVIDVKRESKLIISYSISNKLKMLGYTSHFKDISNEYEKLISEEKEIISKSIIGNIISDRILNLKKIIIEFQKSIYRILNNYSEPNIVQEDTSYFSNKMNNLVEKHKKKIADMNISDKNHKVFKHWKGVVRGIFPSEV